MKRRQIIEHSRIITQRVHTAKVRLGATDQPLDVGGLGDVDHLIGYLMARLGSTGYLRSSVCRSARTKRAPSAANRRAMAPPGGAGDHGDLTVGALSWVPPINARWRLVVLTTSSSLSIPFAQPSKLASAAATTSALERLRRRPRQRGRDSAASTDASSPGGCRCGESSPRRLPRRARRRSVRAAKRTAATPRSATR